MINLLNISGVRGIELELKLKKLNVLSGRNASGKSTIINMIREMYEGKTTIKEGKTSIVDTDGLILQNINGALPGKIDGLGNSMKLMTPGFFMGTKTIKGINDTKENKRKTISDILGINRDQFFIEKGIDYDLKGLHGELKELGIKERTYTEEIIQTEGKIAALEKPKKPKAVVHKAGTEDRIEKGNAGELSIIKAQLSLKPLQEGLKVVPVKPKEVLLVEEKIISKGNLDQYNKMKSDLDDIIAEGKSVTDTCPTCGQSCKGIKESFKKKYQELAKKMNEFEIIEDQIQEGNNEVYQQYLSDLNKYNLDIQKINSDNEAINKNNTEHHNILKQIESFAIVEDKIIKGVKGNDDEYNEYVSKKKLYDEYQTTKDLLEKRIEELSDKITKLNSKDIEDKIEAYKDVEKEFIGSIENKLVVGPLRMIFYRELETPNAAGDMYASEFDIEYNNKLYTELSGGERGAVDIILASIFIKKYDTIDFLLIDDAEIGTQELKSTIKLVDGFIPGLQIITTRISDNDLKLSHKF